MLRFRGGLLVSVLAVLVAPHLKADVVRLSDNYGLGSMTMPAYYFSFGGPESYYYSVSADYYAMVCGSEPCAALEGYPDSVAANTIPGTVFIGNPGGYVSDEIATTISGTDFVWVRFDFTFGLDLTGSPFTCASVGGCALTYNGSVQDVGVITYGPGMFGPPVDGFATTLQFQYGPSTPEPSAFSTLALGLAGLACLVGMRRRVKVG
jgi:MYXO-CTERM domain-containing protein